MSSYEARWPKTPYQTHFTISFVPARRYKSMLMPLPDDQLAAGDSGIATAESACTNRRGLDDLPFPQ